MRLIIGAVFLGIFVGGCCNCADASISQKDVRVSTNIDLGWKFYKGDADGLKPAGIEIDSK